MKIDLNEMLITTYAAQRTIKQLSQRPEAQLSTTELLQLNKALKTLIVAGNNGYKLPPGPWSRAWLEEVIVSSF
ncbi:MAG: hypothetical protein JNK48_06790 [Bryobacterales bacterium]|nr:hypothetical protein [Bryobacterales bacterium]